MKGLQRAISYLLHPIFIPILGTLIYFRVTPKYNPLQLQGGNILPIFILTVIIPIIAFFILRNVGLVKTVVFKSARERKYGLYIMLSLLLLIVIKVIPNNYISELYNFFIGLIAGVFSALVLLFFRFKTSMHVFGISSVLMYVISLSIHFEINLTLVISFLMLLTGVVGTSRLYLKAHNKAEIIIGFLLGIGSQLLTLQFWL